MEKKKIILPKVSSQEIEYANTLKNALNNFKVLGETSIKIEEKYIANLKDQINSILQSKLSNKEKLIQLIEKKSSIEKDRIDEKFGDRKRTIDNKALPLLKIEIDQLKELIRINVDSPTNEKNDVVAKADETEINSASIQINSAKPELTLLSAKKPKVYFNKIKPTYSVEDIAKLFSKLYLTINEANQKPFLSKEDVEHLLAQTIEGYTSEQVEHRMLKANFNSKQQGLFYAFIYSFYTANQQGSADEKTIYAKFIQANFKGFGNKPVDQIYKRLRAAIGSQKTHPLIK